MIKKVFQLPSYVDFNGLVDTRYTHCHCLALSTDMETYLEVEGHCDDCINSFTRVLYDNGWLLSLENISDTC